VAYCHFDTHTHTCSDSLRSFVSVCVMSKGKGQTHVESSRGRQSSHAEPVTVCVSKSRRIIKSALITPFMQLNMYTQVNSQGGVSVCHCSPVCVYLLSVKWTLSLAFFLRAGCTERKWGAL